MDKPPADQSLRRNGALFCAFAAGSIGVLALVRVAYVLREFYVGTASLAAGTEIRPMGVDFQLGVAWTASILIGSVCALAGLVAALIQRRWLVACLALFTVLLAWAPMVVSFRGFQYVVSLRKLVLAD